MSTADHFGHRESNGIVVDLFWNHGRLEDAFRVEVADEREGTRLVLHPATGKAAIQAFHHPFAVVEDVAQNAVHPEVSSPAPTEASKRVYGNGPKDGLQY
jgi:hypothetical protein